MRNYIPTINISSLLKSDFNTLKAKNTIKWKPNLNLDKTIKLTIEWYKHYSLDKKKIKSKSISQIENFNKLIKKL